jgi:hypothetical protein
MASCPIPPASCGYQYFSAKTCNSYTVFGALVGGPDQDDRFKDTRDNYQQTEVAIDYNAGFTGGCRCAGPGAHQGLIVYWQHRAPAALRGCHGGVGPAALLRLWRTTIDTSPLLRLCARPHCWPGLLQSDPRALPQACWPACCRQASHGGPARRGACLQGAAGRTTTGGAAAAGALGLVCVQPRTASPAASAAHPLQSLRYRKAGPTSTPRAPGHPSHALRDRV